MKTLIAVSIAMMVLLSGCGKGSAKDQARKLTNRAGRAVGEGAGTFFSGVGEGVEKVVTDYDIRPSEELKSKGMSVTIAKHESATESGKTQHVLSLYVLNRDAVGGTLRIKLFNEAGQEIGRSTAEVDFKPDDARYVQFPLEKEVPTTLAKYIELDLKKE